MTPPTPDLRQYLIAAYSDEELTTFCADYFRAVYEDFATGMSKGQKIQRLLDYCEHRELLGSLAADLARDRPDQFRARFAVPGAPRAAPTPIARDPACIFISHAHEDADFAHRLAADLGRTGWRTWITPESIRPGEKWAEAINRGLEECGVFVVALTPAAVASGWVRTETDVAIELMHSGEAQFIPLHVADCRPPALWRAFQRISFIGRYAAGLTELRAALRPEPPAILTLTAPIRLPLIRIPAGEFLMGSAPAVDKDADADEQPQHRLYLPDFYIGKVPVTNAQFEAFVTAKPYKTQAEESGSGWAWTGSKWDWVKGADWRHPRGPQTGIADKGDHPVVQVSWHDAVAFCRWLSEATGQPFRLPTEAEWEKAARGPATGASTGSVRGRIYPWGDEPPDKTRCNFGQNVGDTTPVGQYAAGATPDTGVLDLAGNVWEWTGSLWGKDVSKPDFGYPYKPGDGREDQAAPDSVLRIVRGGSWYSGAKGVRCACRNRISPGHGCGNRGFRVARSSP